MKPSLLLLLFMIIQSSLSQNTHHVLVKINQPETCITTGIEDSKLHTKIYPNPASRNVEILSDKKIEKLIIVDATGRIIYSKTSQGRQLNIDTSTFSRGIYQCIIKYSNGTQYSKLILQ